MNKSKKLSFYVAEYIGSDDEGKKLHYGHFLSNWYLNIKDQTMDFF